MKYEWIRKNSTDLKTAIKLQKELAISPLFAQILVQRGITSRGDFETKIKLKDFQPCDPFLMAGMERCCARIHRAIEHGERILIYGDYDADGVTATSVLYETLTILGADVRYYIPDRFMDGYGPNLGTYQRILKTGVSLLITVDNGISGTDAFAWAKQNGIDVIVTDHHEIPKNISKDIYGLIHPEDPRSDYPNKKLAGVGVAFKLATALLGKIQKQFLDLVAIGTISDVVELTPENRYFVLEGLKIIRNRERLGLNEILNQCKIESKNITDETIGFQIAPRINSAGRLNNAGFVVELLTTLNESLASRLAEELETLNQKRKELSQHAFEEAWEKVHYSQDKIIIAASSKWHEGIIGIVAAKIAEKKNRPTVIFHINQKTKIAKGSARTSGEINLYNILNTHRDMLLSFGGHAGAAGMSIKITKLQQFHDVLQKSFLEKDKLKNKILINTPANLSDFTEKLFLELEALRPFGPGNEQPVFSIKDFTIANSFRIGQAKEHLKLTLANKKVKLPTIGFRFGSDQRYFTSNNISEVAVILTLNNWKNKYQLQLQLLDYIPEAPLIFDQREKPLQLTKWRDQNVRLIFFSKKNANIFRERYKQVTSLATDNLLNISKVALIDQPKNKRMFYQFFMNNPQLSQITISLMDPFNLAITGFPTRSEFSKCYKLIYRQKCLPLTFRGLNLGLKPAKMRVILNVFFDLKFVTIKKGFLLINKKAEFHSLLDSPVYQKYLDKYEFQNEFLLCSSAELKTKIMSYYKKNEEV